MAALRIKCLTVTSGLRCFNALVDIIYDKIFLIYVFLLILLFTNSFSTFLYF